MLVVAVTTTLLAAACQIEAPAVDGPSSGPVVLERPDETLSLEVTVRDWQILDAMMDNVAAVEVIGGDERMVELARAIRDAGWEQMPPGPESNGGWPPDDEIVDMALTRGQWAFAAEQLVYWADLSAEVDADGRLDPAERDAQRDADRRARATAAAVGAALERA